VRRDVELVAQVVRVLRVDDAEEDDEVDPDLEMVQMQML